MWNRNELEVRPVKRYRVPKYPSHLDPDPTQFPQVIPYPASQKLLAAVASMGIMFVSACNRPGPQGVNTQGTTASSNNTPDFGENDNSTQVGREVQDTLVGTASDDATQDVESGNHNPFLFTATDGNNPTSSAKTKHPFSVEVSGLPHRTSPYGTGVPNYMTEEVARGAIERVFKEAGIQLTKNVQYDKDGVAFVADGYNAKENIGYIFADWRKLDKDAYISWNRPKNATIAGEAQAIIQRSSYDESLKSLAEDIKKAQKVSDAGKREAALTVLLENHRKKLLSLDEYSKLESRADDGEEFIAVISQFDRRFSIPDIDIVEYQKLRSIADPAKRAEAMRQLSLKAAQKSIEKLEQSVREYIRWSRAQGAG